MERCLGHKHFETILLYLDDVIIYSNSYEDHLKHLAEVFQILIKHGLKVKPFKCYLLKTEATIRRRFYWIGMRGDIEKWFRECSTCAVGRNEKHDQKAPLHPIVSRTLLEIVAIDHVKLEPSRSGYTYAMTIIDHYTNLL